MFVHSRKFAQLQNSEFSLRSNRSRFSLSGRDDSIDDAIDIGKLSKSFKYDDDGEVSDDEPDFYKFKIKGSGTLKFNFKNEGEESITFSIVNKRGRLIAADGRRLFREVDDDEKGKLNARLGKGTYYLRISTDGDNEDYSFKLKFRSNNDNDDDD